MFRPVPTRVDYVNLEHEVQAWWDEHRVLEKYLKRNEASEKRWSFIDGPMTANNPMAVHHAWGRSYKDLYQRLKTMQGYRQRYQNGFDCQGLWIEVEVEKEKGFSSKRDIERYGVAEFVEACKERVQRFADQITQQSLRLGYWMDWDTSYYTNSNENNFSIWGFLKKCWEKGWLYKGKDSMPWCPRCGTGISQHEIVTEGYQEITHRSVYLKFPITGKRANGQTGISEASDEIPSTGGALDSLRPSSGQASAAPQNDTEKAPQNDKEGAGGAGSGSARPEALEGRAEDGPKPGEALLVWTTTPWTLAANVAAAVHPELTYVRVKQGDDVFYVSKGALATAVRGEHEVLGEVRGSELVGLTYRGPFDELPAQEGIVHRVIEWDEVSDEEGTGIVHIAPGAGSEDFALSKVHDLAVIAPLEEDGTYTVGGGFGFLEGRFAGDVAADVFASLRDKGLLYRVQDYTHRYPTCWRCGSELVFRLVDEWFIAMDEVRPQIMEVVRKVRWIPEFGLARELDWLRNMDDWMISKKRYYGLALPIYECQACSHFEVIGSEVELKERAIQGWDEFEGHSAHRPWIDAVQIACANCGAPVERIRDVGNPWLDAGIVPYSTLNYRHDRAYWEQWFPADWVSESFPGQFRNWFYALLAMGTVMNLGTEHENEPPFKTLFGYGLLRDEKGDEMHKSKGNAIWFEDAAERMGVDVMRWMFARTNPANNLNFGWTAGDEIKRSFLSTLWNTYSFFVTYANIDGWVPTSPPAAASPSPPAERGPADAPSVAGRGEDSSPPVRPEALEGASGSGGGSAEGAAPLPGGMGGVPPTSLNSPAEQTDRDAQPGASLTELDRWALSESNQLVAAVTRDFEGYDSMSATRRIEEFVEVLSNWYVRRSRRRFWKSEDDGDKRAAYETLYTCLETVNLLLAPVMPFVAEDMYQNLVRSWNPDAPESVHLCDWPQANEALIDDALSGAVRLIQRLASLGRSARSKANVRVRQPLARVHVKVTSDRERETVLALAEQLLEELNVKELELISDEADFFDYQVRPNLPVLGPKYGSEVGRIQRALAQADKAQVAQAVRARRTVALDGVELQPDEVLVNVSGKPGYAVAEEAGYAVAVTTEVTPELADEGLARELVRRIQEMRKSAGFEIADRIRLGYEGDADVGRVIEAWREYIAQETLAEEIAAGADGDPSTGPGQRYVEEHNIDGRRVKLAVEKL